MFSVIRNNLIVKNLVPQNKQFIKQLVDNKTKFDFASITIVDSCHKTSSNFANNNIFPNIESIYLFSPNYTKISYNKLLKTLDSTNKIFIEFNNGGALYSNNYLFENNFNKFKCLTKEQSELMRSNIRSLKFDSIYNLPKYETNKLIKYQIEYYNDWITKY